MRVRRRAFLLPILLGMAAPVYAQPVTVSVDAQGNRHQISPAIYGVHFADTPTLLDLNATVNRLGGNSVGRYNWQKNIDNRGADYFFMAFPYANTAGGQGDQFIADTKAGGAEPFLSMPMVGWVADTNANRDPTWSFSEGTYGPFTGTNATDGFPDAGNGCISGAPLDNYHPCGNGADVPPGDGRPFTANNPNDASVLAAGAFQQGWMQHVKDTHGAANAGGLKYWGLDNEPSIWHTVYWDVHPVGPTAIEMRDKMIDYGSRIKAVDPGAQVLGPEEWGWDGYFYSGYDQQRWSRSLCSGFDCPDRVAIGGDYVPWLLSQMKQYRDVNGTRILDMLTLHVYPQGGEIDNGGNNVSNAMQLQRNRSTRSLWDVNYADESWIATQVKLIPRMRAWVASSYLGTKLGLTEYDWGAESHINGATAQADLLGIFGREGLDMAIRWVVPQANSPVYNAFKMYRNYDGAKSSFGETSLSATVPQPDDLAAFAAQRANGTLTVMVVSKVLSGDTQVDLQLANFTGASLAEVWQLTSLNSIDRLPDVTVVGGTSIAATLPAQSVTLFVVPQAATAPPSVSIFDASAVEGASGTNVATFTVSLSTSSVQTVTVPYATANDSATAGPDYTAASGTLTILAGETSQPLPVAVQGDLLVEGDETFFVNLGAPTNATLGDGQGVGTILDDDPATAASLAEFVMLGQTHQATIALGDLPHWFKVRLVAGRSYAASAWAPGTDPSESPVNLDLAWFLDDGATAAGGAAVSVMEPAPQASQHTGAAASIIPTSVQCVAATGCTYRVRLQATGALTTIPVKLMVTETTLVSPYWQVVVGAGYDAAPQIRNNASTPVLATFTAYGNGGTTICSNTFTVPANAMTTFGIGGSAPGCGIGVGFGSAQIAHHGPPGSLTANITSFSAVSGLSFDAPFRLRNTWSSLHSP